MQSIVESPKYCLNCWYPTKWDPRVRACRMIHVARTRAQAAPAGCPHQSARWCLQTTNVTVQMLTASYLLCSDLSDGSGLETLQAGRAVAHAVGRVGRRSHGKVLRLVSARTAIDTDFAAQREAGTCPTQARACVRVETLAERAITVSKARLRGTARQKNEQVGPTDRMLGHMCSGTSACTVHKLRKQAGVLQLDLPRSKSRVSELHVVRACSARILPYELLDRCL